MRLLLVEDDVMVASGIKLGLTDAGYAVDWVGSAERALEVTQTESFDVAVRVACIRGEGQIATPLELGPREWTVMEYLLLQAPKPANKDKLLQALTGWDKEITPNAVEVYISRLRGKLEPHGVALRSIRGFGYRLELIAA
eukprot:gene22166-22134_t